MRTIVHLQEELQNCEEVHECEFELLNRDKKIDNLLASDSPALASAGACTYRTCRGSHSFLGC
jgi:hypothetical protein